MSTASHTERAAAFLARHRKPGTFVLPNAWDPGSARILVAAGFEALGTTSAGIAFAEGLPDDGRVGRARMLERVAAITAAVPVAVSADLESGYGDAPREVAETIRRAVAAGVAGANIEDAAPQEQGGLFPTALAAERVEAARRAADEHGTPFTLNARIDTFLVGAHDPFAEAALRAERYVAAGADCVFVPGVSSEPDIARLVEAIDAPLNIVAGLHGKPLELSTYQRLGVRRISIGGSLARAVLGFVRRAAHDMLAGRLDHARAAIAHDELNRLMTD